MSMNGKRIAVTGPRKGEEISTLIKNMGGIPYVRPTQGTIILDEKQVEPDLQRLINEGTDWLILTTGIGSQTLLEMSEKLGLREQMIDLLHKVKIAARGYKTRQFLKSIGLKPDISDDDGTVRGLIKQFSGIGLGGQRVAVQLYGEKSDTLRKWLTGQGAVYTEIMPYIHIPPPESEVQRFLDELLNETFDAVAFTSAIQVHFLFQAAERFGVGDKLRQIFAGPTVAVAVGVVTAEALEDAGVSRIVQPEDQRMGAMIVEIRKYFEKTANPNT